MTLYSNIISVFYLLQEFIGDVNFEYGTGTGIFEATEESIPESNSKQIHIKLINPGELDPTETYRIKVIDKL